MVFCFIESITNQTLFTLTSKIFSIKKEFVEDLVFENIKFYNIVPILLKSFPA